MFYSFRPQTEKIAHGWRVAGPGCTAKRRRWLRGPKRFRPRLHMHLQETAPLSSCQHHLTIMQIYTALYFTGFRRSTSSLSGEAHLHFQPSHLFYLHVKCVGKYRLCHDIYLSMWPGSDYTVLKTYL